MVAGSVTGVVAHGIKENVEDEDAKEFFGFVSDCGVDVFKGGAVGGAFDAVSGAIGGAVFQNSSKAMNNAAKVVQKAGDRSVSTVQAAAFARHSTAVGMGRKISSAVSHTCDAYSSANEIEIHNGHKRQGIDYQPGCKICEV
jgi:hypothetical protein